MVECFQRKCSAQVLIAAHSVLYNKRFLRIVNIFNTRALLLPRGSSQWSEVSVIGVQSKWDRMSFMRDFIEIGL